jgi:hypothetical protein
MPVRKANALGAGGSEAPEALFGDGVQDQGTENYLKWGGRGTKPRQALAPAWLGVSDLDSRDSAV